jgi:hypothetical protein
MDGGFFTTLFAKLSAIVAWFASLFVNIFIAAWDILRDFVCWIFEQICGLALAAVSGLDLAGITNGIASMGSIPANAMFVLSAVGLGQALAIVSSAILIRFTLQLIPFVRLGS